jgi:hypothetical protein
MRGVALEASPEVHDAAVLVDPDDLGGRLRLVVVPWSMATPPEPSPQLLHGVAEHVRARCPAATARYLSTASPTFVPVGVDATIAGESDDAPLFDRIRSAVEGFLHPVTGGVDGVGWPLGATIDLSHFATLLEGIEGVDFTEGFTITVDGAVVGDGVTLAADELPTVGVVRIRLTKEAL